ncbi:hypothetical protein RQP46_010563 [Phenoliferia psychrophenolica]
MRLSVVLSLVAAYATPALAQLAISSGSLSVLNSVGITSASSEFTSSAPSPIESTTLSDGDVLKLAFAVTEAGVPVQPHQAMLLWTCPTTNQQVLSTVKVRKGGKGRYELDLSRAPSTLLSLPSPLSLSLLIGTFASPSALSLPLGSFSFSPSLTSSLPAEPSPPAGWETERFSLMPEITWTEREKEKTVGSFKAILGTVVVLAPWTIFLGVIASLSLPVSISSPSSLAFLASLFSFEALLATYWRSDTMKLIPTLPVFALIALATALSGRRALGVLKVRREMQASKAKKSQ